MLRSWADTSAERAAKTRDTIESCIVLRMRSSIVSCSRSDIRYGGELWAVRRENRRGEMSEKNLGAEMTAGEQIASVGLIDFRGWCS